MRPISSAQSVLRNPLNEILGTEANVRLLRVLTDEVEGSLSAPDIAERAGLSVMGARKALERLVDSGFVELVGGGRKQQYALRESEPLMKITTSLFRAERQRYEELMDALRQESQQLSPSPQSVWIRNLPLQLGDPLEIGILGESAHTSATTSDARRRFAGIEQKFDVTIEVSGYTRADLPDLNPQTLLLLAGVPPVTPPARAASWKPNSHRDLDERSSAWSKALVSAIEDDPSLIRRARAYLDRLLKNDQGTAQRDLSEWRKILELYPRRRLLRFMESSTPRACRLRQSSPFLAVLSNAERARLQDLQRRNRT
ncbi:MAG TPA: winged helix-turn-helix domain-containing protein [Kiritimatiellia bacterium]|nr:winged helix-turn-helix domain-containing protein [Kiritimatiellia bacterium]